MASNGYTTNHRTEPEKREEEQRSSESEKRLGEIIISIS